MENDYQIKLFCWECDHPTCQLNKIFHSNSQNGCTRSVSEDLYIEYYHQIYEVWPFNKTSTEYKKTIDILYKVYRSKIAHQKYKKDKPEILKDN